MHGWGLFFFLLFLLLIFAAVGWVVFTQLRARRRGLPAPTWQSYVPFMKSNGSGGSSTNYPTPRSAGPLEWMKDQIDRIRNKRTARGAYEETSGLEGGYAGQTGRGRGRGLEDDAWDTRVGNEDPYGAAAGAGYGYEEQELGLTPTPGLVNEPYGAGAGSGGDYMAARGGGGGGRGGENPFGDHNEAASLRSISPRPEGHGHSHTKSAGSLDSAGDTPTSPNGTRKSAFRERI